MLSVSGGQETDGDTDFMDGDGIYRFQTKEPLSSAVEECGVRHAFLAVVRPACCPHSLREGGQPVGASLSRGTVSAKGT